jgi:hypothetical protein
MTRTVRDYGAPAGAVKTTVRRLAPFAIGGVAVAIAALVWLQVKDRAIVVKEASDEVNVAAITGPPCPALTREAYLARQLDAPKSFDFEGLHLSRRFGHAQCGVAATHDVLGVEGYPVCQFTSPDVLAVQQGQRLWLFEPGLGRKASIIARGGHIACVMAAPYWS